MKIAFLLGLALGSIIGAIVPPLGSLCLALFAMLAALALDRMKM